MYEAVYVRQFLHGNACIVMVTIPALNFTVKQSVYTVVVMLKYSGELKHAQENSKGEGAENTKTLGVMRIFYFFMFIFSLLAIIVYLIDTTFVV